MKKYLDEGGLVYLWGKIKTLVAGSNQNQNAFSKIKVGSSTIEADAEEDTLEIVGGTNITITPDASNDKITISASHPTYTAFTGKPTQNLTPTWGGTFTILQIKQSTSGQVSATDRTVTIPSAVASDSADGLMSSGDYSKLYGIATGAEVNQNAFSNVKVGSSTIAADTKTDTLELVAGSNVTLTPDATNDKVTISVSTGAIPDGSSTTPKMDGTAAVGTETTWAHGDHVHPTDTSRAPKNHASSDTIYGKGTTSNYGHVKLSDSTSSTSAAASGGIAATPKAVNDVKNLIPTISYDSTNNKIISTVNGTSTDIVTAETLASAADRVFWATFGTTTAAELIDAVASNKIVLLKIGEADSTSDAEDVYRLVHYQYIYVNSTPNGEFVFSKVIANGSEYIIYQSDSNGWQWGTIQTCTFETRDNKSYSISGTETSNSNDYPTNYAVKTYVNSVLTNGYIPLSYKGHANGVCPLNEHSIIDPVYLPSYVDDVVEAYDDIDALTVGSSVTVFGIDWLYTKIKRIENGQQVERIAKISPEDGKVYVIVGSYDSSHPTYGTTAASTYMDNLYRWGGSQYIKLNDGGLSRMTTSDMDTATSNWT